MRIRELRCFESSKSVMLAIMISATAIVFAATQTKAETCIAEGRQYPEGARVESYRITGVRTRTAVPVYVVCRGTTWVWPSTNEPVVRQRK